MTSHQRFFEPRRIYYLCAKFSKVGVKKVYLWEVESHFCSAQICSTKL